jgi:hypothetical protein
MPIGIYSFDDLNVNQIKTMEGKCQGLKLSDSLFSLQFSCKEFDCAKSEI